MRSQAPGKIIISGEHSVVYGQPALVMAVDRYATATISPQASKLVSFDLLDFHLTSSFTLRALHELKDRLVKNYHMFLQGELSIREVLSKPFDLFHFLVITFLDGLHLTLERGVHIKLESNIPIGCGMGSSAATILSVLRGITEFFALDFIPDTFYQYGLEAEKLQHGRPSGVDPYISLHGGFVRFQNKEAEKKELPSLPMYLINTGLPESTTGECVSFVASHFNKNPIWLEFNTVTENIEKALSENDLLKVQHYIKQNNKLLKQIGVVPNKVQSFIADIENWGAAAKTSGAGAVTGNRGGIVLVFSEQSPHHICEKYGYELIPIKGESIGARIL